MASHSLIAALVLAAALVGAAQARSLSQTTVRQGTGPACPGWPSREGFGPPRSPAPAPPPPPPSRRSRTPSHHLLPACTHGTAAGWHLRPGIVGPGGHSHGSESSADCCSGPPALPRAVRLLSRRRSPPLPPPAPQCSGLLTDQWEDDEIECHVCNGDDQLKCEKDTGKPRSGRWGRNEKLVSQSRRPPEGGPAAASLLDESPTRLPRRVSPSPGPAHPAAAAADLIGDDSIKCEIGSAGLGGIIDNAYEFGEGGLVWAAPTSGRAGLPDRSVQPAWSASSERQANSLVPRLPCTPPQSATSTSPSSPWLVG